MKIRSLAFLLCVSGVMVGCGDAGNRTVTEDADAQAIADYEAELARVSGAENEVEMTVEE